MGGLLALIGFVGLVLGLFALVRGRLNWARLRNRKQAAAAAAASFVVFIIGALISPTPTTTGVASDPATSPASSDTNKTTVAASSPRQTEPPSPLPTTPRSTSSSPTPHTTSTSPLPDAGRPSSTSPSSSSSPKRMSRPQRSRQLASLHTGPHGAVMPDRHRTPGAVFDRATRATVCTTGYSAQVRDVTDTTRRAVFADYGIPWSKRHSYEVDHLIPLELGGSNNITNLWPQPEGSTSKGYPRKDRLENHLHALVCAGRVRLRTAQHALATNWINAYNRYQALRVHPSRPTPKHHQPKERHQPAKPVVPGGGATAQCNDGTYSYAAHHQGACSHHHGVRTFYK